MFWCTRPALFVVLASVLQVTMAHAQLVAIDTTRHYLIQEVVVTATRTAKSIEHVPVPISVIPASEIEAQGVARLSDLLNNQLGFNLQRNRLGSVGVQLQGLDAAYTLVLLDGEPLVGNIEGFVDISRIPASSIERVEITHGPSSSLYGSEALAGVVNIITKKRHGRLATSVQAQYAGNNTLDLNGAGHVNSENTSARIFLNRYSTGGYDLFEELPGPTVPAFVTYDATGRVEYRMGSTTIRGNGRASTQHVDGISAIQQGVPPNSLNQSMDRFDWSVSPAIQHNSGTGTTLSASTHAARSTAKASYEVEAAAGLIDFFDFDQFRSETQFQIQQIAGSQLLVSGGGGVVFESVEADFMAGNRRSATSGYSYGQGEWVPHRNWDVIASLRLDAHPDYETQLNPKLAGMWSASRQFRVQASVGRGFRAPTFEQRYVNFTNPLGGNYTVLGTDDLERSLQAFEDAGLIKEWLVDPSSLRTVGPETSWAFTTGATITPNSRLSVRGLLFRNDVSGLIETQVLAIKSDGQNLFSYVNLGEVYTQGFEVDVDYNVWASLDVTAGYQYLDAYSKDLDAPLAGRPPHSGRIKLSYTAPGFGVTAFVQGIYRSAHPFVTGAALEVDGYSLWDITVSKDWSDRMSTSFGVRNLFDHTAPVFQPEQSGRDAFVRVIISS